MAIKQRYLDPNRPELGRLLKRSQVTREYDLDYYQINNMCAGGILGYIDDPDEGRLIMELSLNKWEAESGHVGPSRRARCQRDVDELDALVRSGEPMPDELMKRYPVARDDEVQKGRASAALDQLGAVARKLESKARKGR